MAGSGTPGGDGGQASRHGACAFARGDIAAHVLGAIDGAEQARVVAHLLSCPRCKATYDELIPLRDWLGRLSWRDIVMF